MLLKKLSLTNFRPFKGEHSIEFSTDKERNVTLVMAENGAGKTTLAQAFQWVLYGRTEGFKNKSVLNSVVENEMMGGTNQYVTVSLELEHNKTEYTIIRKQIYKKDINGNVKPDNSISEIYIKNKDGQTVVNNELKNPATIASILPESLSKYFFFDGERIEKMATEVNEGKSDEFKTAVQNILGLTALTNAINHLNPKSSTSVIGRYNAQIDQAGGQQTKELRDTIYSSTEKIEKNNKKIEKIEGEIEYYNKEIDKTKADILSYAEVEKQQQALNRLNDDLNREQQHKINSISLLMSNFNKQTYHFMTRKLINDALNELKDTDNVDKGVPDVSASTIKYLIDRKKCLCGCDLDDPTSKAVQELTVLLKYIPPESLGGSINQFQKRSRWVIKSSDSYFSNIETQLGAIRGCSNKIEELEHEIGEIDDTILKSSNAKIKDFKSRQIEMEHTRKYLKDKLEKLKIDNGILDGKIKEAEAEISRLQLKIEKNQLLETKILYARAAYNRFKQTYDFQEAQTREKLEDQINQLFKQIYAGGMTINIDEKYKINSYVNELQDNSSNIDANTARSYSIIFAFIVGVINLAKQKVNDKTSDSSIITDEYPLVMDAPLSSFDQRRIKNICEVIPNIARQVIIFIKDSDGNIAKNEMRDKIGIEYEVSLRDKNFPVDSKITKVGD